MVGFWKKNKTDMFIYYVSIFYFILAGVIYNKIDKNVKILFDIFSLLLFVVVFGSRFEVGADWFNYVRIYDSHQSDLNIFTHIEAGYKALNVIGHVTGLGYQFVIFSSSFLFFICTHYAVKRLGINPYFYLAIIAPYHLVMSGMNYTRQSIALSMFVLSFSFLISNNKVKNIIAMCFGILFHKSSILMFAISFCDLKKRYLVPIGSILMLIFFYTIFEEYSSRYLETAHYDSKGFYLRFIFLLACSLFILIEKQNIFNTQLLKRIKNAQLLFTGFIFIISFASTTAADRLAYYLIMSGTVLVMMTVKNNKGKIRLTVQSMALVFLFLISFSVFIVWATMGNIVQYYKYQSMLFNF
jgi:hypothetical protein